MAECVEPGPLWNGTSDGDVRFNDSDLFIIDDALHRQITLVQNIQLEAARQERQQTAMATPQQPAASSQGTPLAFTPGGPSSRGSPAMQVNSRGTPPSGQGIPQSSQDLTSSPPAPSAPPLAVPLAPSMPAHPTPSPPAHPAAHLAMSSSTANISSPLTAASLTTATVSLATLTSSSSSGASQAPGASVFTSYAFPPALGGIPASPIGLSATGLRIPTPVVAGSALALGGNLSTLNALPRSTVVDASKPPLSFLGFPGLSAASEFAAPSPSRIQMNYLIEKEKERFESCNLRVGCTSASVNMSSGSYSMSISRGPLPPLSGGKLTASPRTPSVPARTPSVGSHARVPSSSAVHSHADGGARTPSSDGAPSRTPSGSSLSSRTPSTGSVPMRTPSAHSHGSPSRPPSISSRPGSRPPVLHTSPASAMGVNIFPLSVMSSSSKGASPPRTPGSITHGIPLNSGVSARQISQGPTSRSAATEAPLDLSSIPSASSSMTSSGGAGDPLDLTSLNRKRKSEDSNSSDDDVICVGESRRPPLPPAAMTSHHAGKYARTAAPPSAFGGSPYQHASHLYKTNMSAAHHQHAAMTSSSASRDKPAHSQSATSSASNPPGGSVWAQYPPYLPGSIFDIFLSTARTKTKFPQRPVTPRVTRPATPAGRSGTVQGSSRGVIRAAPTSTPSLAHQKLLFGQTALNMQLAERHRAILNAKHIAAQRAAALVAAQASAHGATSNTGKSGLGESHPSRVSDPSRTPGMKKHHSVQIQGGRMLAHSVVPRDTTKLPTNPLPASKDRVSYMMAQEPVPAASASNVTAIQITQQPTYLATSPLLVPNPVGKVMSRISAAAVLHAPSSAGAPSTPHMDIEGKLASNIATPQSKLAVANVSAMPQKHFTNTDTQTADLPVDQWHRPAPFQRMGAPNKNIPVANVNPMVHHHHPHPSAQASGSSSQSTTLTPTILHPKKQILVQSRSGVGQTEVKPDVSGSSGRDSSQTPGSVQLKPEYSSSRDVKMEVAGRERYVSSMKERIIQRIGAADAEVGRQEDDTGSGEEAARRKFVRETPAALHKPHRPHHSGHRPLLSKTVLDLSDITGESTPAPTRNDVTDPRHAASPEKDEARVEREAVGAGQASPREEYAGDTEVESNDATGGEESESSSSDYKPPSVLRTDRSDTRRTRNRQTLSGRPGRPFHRMRGKTGRQRNNNLYNKNAAYERELRKDEYRRLLSRYRRKSRSTRSSPRSLRTLQEVHDYNELDELSDDDGDDLQFDPKGEAPLVRRRFLPKAKRTFFKGTHDGWGSLHNKRRRLKRRGDGEDSDVSRSSSRFNEDSRDGFDARSAPADMRKLVVCKETGETLLHKAARLGLEDVVQYIVDSRGIGMNARDNAGYTPLHETCVRGHLRVARLLVTHGADVNAAALDGTRPIHDAVDNNHVELARLMLACGADMRIATYSGRTCLKLARSIEMQHLINGYISDLNDAEETIPWEFYGSTCTNAANKESGCDVFSHVPSDDEEGSSGVTSLPDCDVMFEFSDVPILPVYTISLKEQEGPRHYYLLKSVLQRLHMGKKELLRVFPDLYVFTVTDVASQIKDARPSVSRVLQREKGFDIVKVSDTLDAALGYTREFLFPDHAHKKLVDLPDSKARRSPAEPHLPPDGVRVKRKYTRRNKDANLKKTPGKDDTTSNTATKEKTNEQTATGNNAMDLSKTSSVMDGVVTSQESRDTEVQEHNGGTELPVLERQLVATAERRVSIEEGAEPQEPHPEDRKMPELTIAF